MISKNVLAGIALFFLSCSVCACSSSTWSNDHGKNVANNVVEVINQQMSSATVTEKTLPDLSVATTTTEFFETTESSVIKLRN